MTSRAAVSASILALLASLSGAGLVTAQSPTSSADVNAPDAVAFDGAPPPVPPAVDSRDERGRVTLRAVRLESPLQIDGHLDEAIYQATISIDHFEQQVPREGASATERTQAWILFDDENLYFCARMLDSEPDRIVANEMRHEPRD